MTLALNLPPQPESPLCRLDPRWKLATVAVAIATMVSLQTLFTVALGVSGVLAIVALGRVPWKWYGARLALLAPFLGLLLVALPFFSADAAPLFRVGPASFSLQGFYLALTVVLKAVAVVSLVCVLLTAAPLHDTLHAAHRLRVPGILVQLAALAYRYSFLLADEVARMRLALRVRGYRNRPTLHSYRTVAHVIGMLIVRGHERGEQVSHAMACRGFDGRFRTLGCFRTKAADVLFFGAVTGVCLILVLLELSRDHAL